MIPNFIWTKMFKMGVYLQVFWISLILFNVFGAEIGNLIVETNSGKVRGKISKDRKGNDFYSFEKIPYAQPPVGSLRFKVPVPVKHWDGILDATEKSPICPQNINKSIMGQEDCLFLNIYTPQLPNAGQNGSLKSVMFYIHGGGFFKSAGSFHGPEFLLPGDVVLVTINYRLGLLGSLVMKNENLGVHGNIGMKDQVMALKWIKENIKYFGGNPDSITLFGESAGGASVHLHMFSSMSRGLFKNAIAQSGCALNDWIFATRENGKLLTDHLNISASSDEEQLRFLQNISYEKILEAQFHIMKEFGITEHNVVGVVLETQTTESAFLSEHPKKLLSAGNYYKVPIMIGYTDKEGLMYETYSKIKKGNFVIIRNYTEYLPVNLRNVDVENKIRNFYENITYDKEREYLLPTINFLKDIWFANSIHRSVLLHSSQNNLVYFYEFSLDSKLNIHKNIIPEMLNYTGASHADDKCYLFLRKLTPEIKPGSREDVYVDRVVTLWTNFAKFSEPKADNFFNSAWKPFESAKCWTMKIAEQMVLEENFELLRQVYFWNDIYKNHLD